MYYSSFHHVQVDKVVNTKVQKIELPRERFLPLYEPIQNLILIGTEKQVSQQCEFAIFHHKPNGLKICRK